MKKRVKKLIGRKDHVDLPDLGLFDIDAKVDTGAYTSALHVHKVKPFRKSGEDWVRFKLKHHSHPGYAGQTISLPVHALKYIRSSSGEEELRYIIRATVVIFGKKFPTEFSLADRSKMDCPVLLGRKLLYRRFVVDVSLVNLSHTEKKTKEKNALNKLNNENRHPLEVKTDPLDAPTGGSR
jgi:hypothetical protein